MTIPQTGISPLPKGTDSDAWITDHALRLLDQMDYGQPFVFVCRLHGPHQPWVVLAEYYDLYDPQQIPQPEDFQPSPREPAFLENSYFRQLGHGLDVVLKKRGRIPCVCDLH